MIPKFRAWDKEENLWIKIASLGFDEEGEMWYLSPVMDDFNPVYYENELGKTWEIMQSTGLQDKNGVDIFEGDIVLANGVQVTVSFGEQKYEENYGDETYYIGFNVFTKMGYGMLIPVKYEVLGNIHENPELLS
ncbi:YopX family protein [Enterococcus diestrammenae]|uniref:YopX family protein n=1 Tax=Enterococcus diestrammenae TaxID=1155073 RepID=UPI00195A1339